MRCSLLVVVAIGLGAGSLLDTHPDCRNWARRGECKANPGYMMHSCKKSCAEIVEIEAAKLRPRFTQSREEVADSLHKFHECRRIPASALAEKQSLTDAHLTEGGEEICLAQCDGHADCLQQCRELSPPSLHRLLQPCAPWPFISRESTSTGMHVMCVLPAGGDCAGLSALLVVFVNGRTIKHPLVLEVPRETATLDEFVALCERLVRRPARGTRYQSSGFFTSMGERLLTLDSLLQTPLVFMQEGGQWIWPVVRVGHEVKITGLRYPGENTTIRTASLVPAVFEIENFLRPEESTHIVSRVQKVMKKSPVQLKDADRGKQATEFRTSSQEFLDTEGDAKLKLVDSRVQRLTGIPITHAESIQVLRYNLKEHYSAHHDFFDPGDYAADRVTTEMIEHGATNRLATVFFYLTNVTRGGQTNFPMAGGLPTPTDYFDCSKGFSSWPQANKVIIFYSMLPSGEMDQHALHGGCDVLEGQKWSANFWLWNKPRSENTDHEERRQTARVVGAVGSPGRREVKYSASAREEALKQEL